MGHHSTHTGSALVVVLAFVAVFSGLAVGMLAASNADLQSAKLHAESRRAHAAAESGLAFICRALPDADVAGTTTAAETLQAVAEHLNSTYGDTLFAGQTATVSGDDVLLPAVLLSFPEGPAQFQVRIVASADDDYRIESVGCCNQCSRTVGAGALAADDSSILGKFGVASRSRIKMSGNADVRGANNTREGSVLSTTYSETRAIDLQGSISLSGDVSLANPEGEVHMVGNPHVGGDLKIGVVPPPFPEADTTPFEPYATNPVGPGTPTSGNCYFENIRIQADTNPTFSGNITIRGIVYVESPNTVHFTGNLDLTGVVVVEPPPGSLDLDHHCIRFTGNTSTNGVEALSDADQFRDLKKLGGAFILAPGYEVEFTGNFSTINGTIVASKFKFTGNAHGTIRGSAINLDDTDFVLSGNTHLTIDHSDLNSNPKGLRFPRRLSYVAGSYSE